MCLSKAQYFTPSDRSLWINTKQSQKRLSRSLVICQPKLASSYILEPTHSNNISEFPSSNCLNSLHPNRAEKNTELSVDLEKHDLKL